MAEVKVGQLPFNEAIEHFQKKLLIPSRQWTDLVGPIHAKAFTVAGATSLELLQDLYSAVQDSILDGTTLTEFRKRFDDIVARHGWSYKGKRGWRTRVIFQTNKRNAYMAGRWAQIWRLKEHRPYLQYLTVGDERVRESHRPWHRMVLAIDHPFWKTHYPPNGWLCRCNVRSLSKAELEDQGLTVQNPEPPTPSDYPDPTTGEVINKYPGVDVGWDYNVGQAWLAPDAIFGQQLMQIPKDLRSKALQWMDTDVFDRPFKSMVDKVALQIATGRKVANGQAVTAGYLTNEVITFLETKNKFPIGAVVVGKDSDVGHALRVDKASRGQTVPLSSMAAFPAVIRAPDVVLYDKTSGDLIYAQRLGNGKYAKFVVRLNFKTKIQLNKSRFKESLNLVKTAGVVAAHNLRQSQYEVIVGEVLSETR